MIERFFRRPATPTRSASRARTLALLMAIVLLGAYFRTLGLWTWDEPSYRLHPDERFFTDVASLIHIPEDVQTYVDSSQNTLNPRNNGKEFYVYGMLPQTITRWTAVLLTPPEARPTTYERDGVRFPNPERTRPYLAPLAAVLNPQGEDLTSYFVIHKVGRAWSALWDVGSIVLTFLIGWRLFGRRVGLLAALFYALAVLPIQLAHFFTVDATTGFFVLLTVYWAIRAAQRGGWGNFALLGLSIGAAMACRVTLATLGLLGVLAVLVQLSEGWRTGTPRRYAPLFGGLLLAGALSLMTFRVLQPDAFVGSAPGTPPTSAAFADRLLAGKGVFDIRPEPRFIGNIQQIGGLISGEVDAPPSQQWAGRIPYLFSLQNLVLWGTGLALGVAAWVGWAWAGWRLRRGLTAVLLPWGWVAFYFAWQGGQFVMTMRYYALLYGLLAIFAAALLLNGKTLLDGTMPKIGRGRVWASAAVATLTLLWAVAFTRIYTEPHSRVQASRWIYANIPAGTIITSEEWDDPLPLSIDGRSSGIYTGLQTKPYYEDDPVKYIGTVGQNGSSDGLLDELDQAEYLIFSSNRVYDSATRMPARYPALTRYYNALFEGKLGFELAADIHSYPNLFGIDIPTPVWAEEAFSVYDHPRVLIFRKTAAYSRANAEQLITNPTAWSEVFKLPTVKASKVPTALRLTETQWPVFRDAGTWAERFGGVSAALAWLPWLLLLESMALAMFALLFRLLPDLPDGGFALSKTLGLLAVGYTGWLLASLGGGDGRPLVPWGAGGLWALTATLWLVGGAVAWRSRVALGVFVRRKRLALLSAEGLFLLVFFGFLLIRALNPDLWHPARGGERPMDLAFLTAVLKSPSFPPYDPWFAGGFINYYYFGFVYTGALALLTGTAPAIAYNLAIPTVAALIAIGAWGVTYNLLAVRRPGRGGLARGERRPIVTGLLSAVFVVLLGNLSNGLWLLPGTADRNDPGMPQECVDALNYASQQICRGRTEWAFWDSTRIVGTALGDSTITEFPAFTLLYGDLHAHLLALPLTLAALGAMVGLVRSGRRLPFRRAALLYTPLLALLVGVLRMTNTWDYPTVLGLSALTLALTGWQRYRRTRAVRSLALEWLAACIGLFVLSSAVVWPFTSHFATDYAGFNAWDGTRTPTGPMLQIIGLWLVLLVVAGLVIVRRTTSIPRGALVGAAGGLALLIAVLTLLKAPALLLLGLLVLAGVALISDLLLRDTATRGVPPFSVRTVLPALWAVAALGITLLTEIVVARGDIGRMNTVFKFGMQAWVLFALSSAVAATWLWGRSRQWQIARKLIWRGALAAGVLLALAFPATAIPARLADRFDTTIAPTLDGEAYLRSPKAQWGENDQQFTFAEDADAIDWMRQNITGTPIVLEAQSEGYRWGGRISINTGLPTLLGWPWHETQQRMVAQVQPVLDSRKGLIEQAYRAVAPEQTLAQLQLYGVEYVVVGKLERALYGPEGAQAWQQLAASGLTEQVYNRGETAIYRIPRGQFTPGVLTVDLPVVPPTIDAGKTLLLPTAVGDLPPVNEFAWNPLAASQPVAVLLWIVFGWVLLLLGLPTALLVFGRWRDGGVAFARLIGLLLLGYAIWLPVSLRLWQYNRMGLVLGLMLALAINVLVLWALGGRSVAVGLQRAIQQVQAGWRAMLLSEGVYLAALLAMLILRAYNPDLWQPIWGGEKPFEFGMLNAMLRSPVMPPYSPFYSDGIINYYYYGLFLVSVPIKAIGVAPAVGFNLALATLFGLLVAGVFRLVAQVAGRTRHGVVGVLLVALVGNLASFFPAGWSGGIGPAITALQSGDLSGFGQRLDAWFVGPSRVIPNTINEFPFWSFLFADLHPHLIALPITVLALAVAYALVNTTGTGRVAAVGRWGLATLTLGSLAVTNSWDFPTYALVIGGAALGAAWRRGGRVWALAGAGALTLLSAGAGLLLYMPFFQQFQAQVGGVGLVTTNATTFRDYFVIYGLYLLVMVALLLVQLGLPVRAPRVQAAGLVALARPAAANAGPLLTAVVLVLTAAGALVLPDLRLRLVLAALIGLGGVALLRRSMARSIWYALWLAVAGWMVSLGMEFVYIRDHLAGGDWYRMNTVFKFGLQVWVLLAVATAIALPHILLAARRAGRVALAAAVAPLAVLLSLMLVFPLVGVPSRVAYRFPERPGPTLDGLAFMRQGEYSWNEQVISLRDDAAAIDWLNRTIVGTPVVLQSSLEFYRAYGVRVAANTGLPTIVSPLHESEQRDPTAVARRDADVQTIYVTPDANEALQLLAKYRVGYVYVGPVERAAYGFGAEKFAQLGGYLTEVYRNDSVQIYQVEPSVASLAPETAVPVVPVVPAPPQQDDLSDEAAELEAQNRADPQSGSIAFGLAQVYQSQGRNDEAAQVLAVAAFANPGDVALHHLLGDILRDLGRNDEAIAAYTQAASSASTAGNYNKLGGELVNMGRPDEAIAALQQAIALDSLLPDPHYNLGRAYEQQGDTAAAIRAYENYLALAADDDIFVGQAREALERLK